MDVNIRPKVEPRFIIIATARPYTQEIKNSKNGAPDMAFNVSINFLSYFQEIYFYMCSLYYFISRPKITSDYLLAAKPIYIEGEAE